VGEALLREFTQELRQYNSGGRRVILAFLKKHYKINKCASKSPFSHFWKKQELFIIVFPCRKTSKIHL